MDTVLDNPNTIQNRQQSDEEGGKKLFDQLSVSDDNPFENLQLSSQIKQSHLEDPQQNQENEEAVDLRQMMMRSKKDKKKLKKKLKTKLAKKKEEVLKENINYNITQNNKKPSKKMVLDSDEDDNQVINEPIKQNSSLKKKSQRKPSQDNRQSGEQDSAEYSSQQNPSEQENNKSEQPDQNDQDDRKFKKRLGGKSRKQRILQKQGFDLKQLGNDAEANYQLESSLNDSDDSFSSTQKKKKGSKRVKGEKGQKKEKKQKLTNEQFMDKLKQIGCEDQVDSKQSGGYNYDSGLEQLNKLRPMKQFKNTIRVQNKLFGNLEMEIEHQINQQENDENPQQILQQSLQLEFKPKSFTSRAGSFLNKVEALKKHRGLEADIDHVQFERMAKEKAKRSISQLMSRIQNQMDDNEEIDIEIKAPTIAKGKSADLINNTMFIVKSLSQKQATTPSQLLTVSQIGGLINLQNGVSNKAPSSSNNQLVKEGSNSFGALNKKKPVSRSEFFRQIKESISVRRSKYVSAQQLKNSMKSSKLQELQDIRKKIEQKRRKQAMYELGEMDDDADNVINELQEEVARHGRMSKDDLRKLLRAEEGLEELDEYEEQKEAKKKSKKEQNDANTPEENNKKLIQTSQLKIEEHQIIKPLQKQDPQRKNQLGLNVQQNVNKTQFNKQADEEKHQHADDMLEQYQGVESEPNPQMDLEADDQNNNDSIDEEQASPQPEDQDEEQQSSGEQIKQQQEESKNENMGIQDIENQVENQKIRKQLQEEGIIMPGANLRRKNIPVEQINLNQYILSNDLNVNENFKSTQPTTQQNIKQISPETQQTLQFKEFKKLRKIAVVIQQKKKKREQQLKRAKEFFQQQAELGSDNQENDDNVKAINKKDDSEEQDGDHLDQELQELIDNAVDINQADQQEAFKKYMEDVKQKDREQLQRILRGDFKRQNQDMPEMHEMEEDERNRIERMQKMVDWMKKRQDDQKGLYAQEDSQEDQMNYYYDYNGNKKKAEDRKRKNDQEDIDNEETPEENDQEIEKKLQFYLMDTISPAKRDTELQMQNDIFMDLPDMFKRGSHSLMAPFGKKTYEHSKTEANRHEQKQEPKQSSSVFNFAGSLFSLAGNKGDKSTLPIQKTKKTTSHMSEMLNKNKSQKPISSVATSNKLSSIFGRASTIKK